MAPKKKTKYSFQFTRRIRTNAFGWHGTSTASKAIKDAIRELKTVAKFDPLASAEGAVVLIERMWKALQHVDSSSGSIGTAVDKGLDEAAAIFEKADLDPKTRQGYLERIWEAIQEEDIGYYDSLPDRWPQFCGDRETMARWADEFKEPTQSVLSDPTPGAYFRGTALCLSCLLALQRYDEIFEILAVERNLLFDTKRYGARALVQQGKLDEAIAYAKEGSSSVYSDPRIDAFCEQVLIDADQSERAYEEYGISSSERSTGLATFNAIKKKYPDIAPKRILEDLIAANPDNPGKYFAATRKAGFEDLALEIANSSRVDPKTLTRAAEQVMDTKPAIAARYAAIAYRLFQEGWGFDVTKLDIVRALETAREAAERSGNTDPAIEQLLSGTSSSPAKPPRAKSPTSTPHLRLYRPEEHEGTGEG